jgi:hypothetical protein
VTTKKKDPVVTIPTSPHRKSVLVVGRSPTVLADTVALLRGKGYTAEATNEFDRVLDSYDVAALDIVVFGGMVPPDTKQRLHREISDRNPGVLFVQGFAGIPGLIAEQVEAAVGPRGNDAGADVTYEAASRSISFNLDRPREVSVVAWWHTAFVPPEPKSTSMTILRAELPAGSYKISLPDEIPIQASFATVSVGSSVQAFIVGAMPTGTTMARFPDPASS